jgi:hypothetical protein
MNCFSLPGNYESVISAWKLWIGDLCLEIMSQWSLPGNYESVISAWKLWVSDLCLEIMSQWYIKCITMFTNRNKNINFEAIVTSLSSSYQTLCDTSDNVCLNLQNWVILYDNRDDFFLLFDWFHIFFLWKRNSKNCKAQSEQVKNHIFIKGVWMALAIFIDFQLFYFLTRTIPASKLGYSICNCMHIFIICSMLINNQSINQSIYF